MGFSKLEKERELVEKCFPMFCRRQTYFKRHLTPRVLPYYSSLGESETGKILTSHVTKYLKKKSAVDFQVIFVVLLECKNCFYLT